MRRLIVLTFVLVIAVSGLAAGATSYDNIKDKFTSIGWGGSDGSLPWSGNWQENGDDDDEKFGNVRVVSSGHCASGNCMQISALTTLLSGPIGATRRADTSGLSELELCFDIKATGSLLGSELQVQVNGGQGWETVKEYSLESEFTDHPTIDIGEFSSEDFRLRFRFTSTLLGSSVYIDNVELRGLSAGEDDDDEGGSTTTTTTIDETTTTTFATATTTTKPDSTTTTSTPRATTTTRQEGVSTSTTSSTTTSTTTPSTSSTLVSPDRESPGVGGAVTTSTTTIPQLGPDESSTGTGPTADGSGIRAAARGLQANFQGDLYGDLRSVSSINGVDFRADYNMAVEIIKASWVWAAVLALLIAWAIVTGLERRRDDLDS
jgi:hypothetical protein